MSTRWIVADEMVRIVAEARLGLATHCLGAAGKILQTTPSIYKMSPSIIYVDADYETAALAFDAALHLGGERSAEAQRGLQEAYKGLKLNGAAALLEQVLSDRPNAQVEVTGKYIWILTVPTAALLRRRIHQSSRCLIWMCDGGVTICVK